MNKVGEILKKLTRPKENQSQRSWLQENHNTIMEAYYEAQTQKPYENNECDNCSGYTEYKYCSLECFCSDIGL